MFCTPVTEEAWRLCNGAVRHLPRGCKSALRSKKLVQNEHVPSNHEEESVGRLETKWNSDTSRDHNLILA